MTLDELAIVIHKSRAARSKYARGEIALDIETLYEIAAALHVRAEQLLYAPEDEKREQQERVPAFSRRLMHFFCCYLDG